MLYIFHPQSLRDSPGGALGSGLPKPLASLRTACAFLSPPVPSGQPRWGIGERSPQTPCVATHCVRFPFTPSPFGTAPVGHWGAVSPNPLRRYALRALSFHPQSLRDSPGGALGSGLPKTPCVATHCVRFPFTPSPFGTAPVGHWGAVSPNPLRRYALRALSFHPQSLRDSPGGALGSGLPKPLASLRSVVH